MKLLTASLLLMAAPLFAAPTVDIHAFPSGTLTVIRDGGDAPDAVFYEGRLGRWLIFASELRDLETRPGQGWTDERGNLWRFTKEGVEHKDSSWSVVTTTRLYAWDSVVGSVEEIIASLRARGKQDAADELYARGSDAAKKADRAAARASSLQTAEKLQPGSVMDPAKLATAASDARAAMDAASAAKTAREKTALGQAGALFFYEQERALSAALGRAGAAETAMDGLVLPAY